MNGREVTQMAFELKEPPRLPVTLIGGGAWMVDQAGKTFAGINDHPEMIADVFIQAFRRIGHDLLWTGSNFINYPMHFLGCPIEDASSDGPMLKGTVIKDLKEASSLDIGRVLENPTMQSIIRSHHLVADAVGKETLAMPTQWGPLSCAARLYGVEPVMDAVFDDPEGLKELVRISTDLIWSVIEPILEHEDIMGANLSDPVASGDLISPDTFRTFVKPFLQDIVGRIQDKGKYAMIHICGDTTGILEDIVDIRPNCFSLEAKVDLPTARKVLEGKVCVAGNVSPIEAFLSGSPDEVIAEARACIQAWGGGGGYVLTLGCDFPKAVPAENVMALMSLKQA